MTMLKLKELYRARHDAEARLKMLDQSSIPSELDKRADFDVRHALAFEAFLKAHKVYMDAIYEMSAAAIEEALAAAP
jgi:hypothetical protein